MIFWIILILAISIFWAFVALVKERNKREINKAKEEIAKGRVIFHSSDVKSSSSS